MGPRKRAGSKARRARRSEASSRRGRRDPGAARARRRAGARARDARLRCELRLRKNGYLVEAVRRQRARRAGGGGAKRARAATTAYGRSVAAAAGGRRHGRRERRARLPRHRRVRKRRERARRWRERRWRRRLRVVAVRGERIRGAPLGLGGCDARGETTRRLEVGAGGTFGPAFGSASPETVIGVLAAVVLVEIVLVEIVLVGVVGSARGEVVVRVLEAFALERESRRAGGGVRGGVRGVRGGGRAFPPVSFPSPGGALPPVTGCASSIARSRLKSPVRCGMSPTRTSSARTVFQREKPRFARARARRVEDATQLQGVPVRLELDEVAHERELVAQGSPTRLALAEPRAVVRGAQRRRAGERDRIVVRLSHDARAFPRRHERGVALVPAARAGALYAGLLQGRRHPRDPRGRAEHARDALRRRAPRSDDTRFERVMSATGRKLVRPAGLFLL